MSAVHALRSAAAGARTDSWLAALAVLAVGGGCVAAFAAVAAGSMTGAVAAGAVAGSGLIILIAAGWVDGLVVTALAVPLPALLSTNEIRIAAVAPVTAVVLAGWLLSLRPAGARPAGAIGVRRATLVLLAAFAVATAFASSWITSARELLNMTVLLVFFLTALHHLGDARAVDRLMTVLTAMAALCGALAVLEMIGVIPGAFPRWGTPFNRAALGFGQPNALGLFLALTAPMAVHAITIRRGGVRVAALFALVVIIAGLFATFSRGSWLALLGGALVLPLAGDRRLLVRVLLGALVLGALLDMVSGGMLRDTAQRTLTDWVIEQRAALTLAGLLMFAAHPVIGVGPGGFAVELDSFGAQVPVLWDYLPTPHNAYVQMGAEAGVIGLIAYVAFLAVCFRHLVRCAKDAMRAGASAAELSLRRCLLWSFATLCVAGLVVWPFSHGTGQAALLLLAAGIALEQRPVTP